MPVPENTYTEVQGPLDTEETQWDGGATAWDGGETFWDADSLGWEPV